MHGQGSGICCRLKLYPTFSLAMNLYFPTSASDLKSSVSKVGSRTQSDRDRSVLELVLLLTSVSNSEDSSKVNWNFSTLVLDDQWKNDLTLTAF